MKEKILKLMTRGDYHLGEAKAKFWVKHEESSAEGTHNCFKALEKYLRAYEMFLFPDGKPIDSFHVLLRTILQKDPAFKQFYDKIFDVKCFDFESRTEKDTFFLFDDEINNVMNILLSIRTFVAEKMKFDKQFLSEYQGTSFMAI
jgi:hypothetical protein